ncbi:MAG: alpha/beta hydrolase [Candidatus Thorarchaeota archaeon]|nr:MAG: alpha/beta hydrolase [Candidatus Thorarchaeota archaeon]
MTVHTEEAGAGGLGPVIFVHGAGGSAATWTLQLRGLSGNIHVIAVDLNGHGKTEDRKQDALGSYLEDIDSVVSQFAQPVLAGHSMGGALTQLYAMKHPEKVKGIILVGTGARLRVTPVIFRLLEGDFEDYVQAFGQFMFHEETSIDMVESSLNEMRKAHVHVVRRDFELCDAYDIMEDVHRIEHPALIIAGEGDVLTPPKYSLYLDEKMPNTELHIIDKAGHAVMLERASAFNQITADWVPKLYES